MATSEEKQAYVDEMVRKRGYVLDYHKVMARHDFAARGWGRRIPGRVRSLAAGGRCRRHRTDRRSARLWSWLGRFGHSCLRRYEQPRPPILLSLVGTVA
jgi:hypothetical protein